MAKEKREKRMKISEALSNGNDRNSMQALYEAALLSPMEDVPKPEPVFAVSDPRHGNVFVGTKGNISLFKGSKKARKTFAISAIAAVVSGEKEIIQFKSMLGRKGKLLYVDTEQGKYDCQKVLYRELNMSGIDIKDFSKHLTFITLREHNPETRRKIIEYAIEKDKDNLDMVIIDGIRDLITSINDEEQATDIVTDLMRWSGSFNIHILSILHENKSNSSSRGHIGTELENKCEAVVRIVKYEGDDTCSAIEAEAMRGHSFDPYLFTIDDEGFPIMADGVEYEASKNKSGKKETPKPGPKSFEYSDIDIETHNELIKSCYINEQGMFDDVTPLSAREFYKRIKTAFAERKHKIGDHKVREFTTKYLDAGMLKDINEDDNGHKKLVPDNDMPF